MSIDADASWLLLVVSLPTASATARMRLWRGLKALGCRALRDGVHLLPAGAHREQALRELGDECTREGGVAWLMQVCSPSAEEDLAYRRLFDRGEEHGELRKRWLEARRSASRLSKVELARLQRKLQREYDALRAIDFFPAVASAETEVAWREWNRHIEQWLSPDEPRQIDAGIERLDRGRYQRRTWATRRRPWVDRIASAWLIQRFIDTEARFKWLAKPSDCPKGALGFDFDGARFTHVGDRVTFETLMASFGLDADPALQRLATVVHQLDVGGEPVPEAAGFEAVLAGAHERLEDDDALLREMVAVLDSLYAHFQRAAGNARA